MSRERNDLIASRVKKWIDTRNEAANPSLGKTREGSIDFLLAARVYDLDLYPDRVRRVFDIFQLCGAVWIFWIEQYPDQSGRRYQLPQQSQPFRTQ